MQDIMHRPAASETEIVSVWLESQRSEEFALLGHDADVGVGDKKMDLPVLVRGTDADVAEPAEVAQGDPAAAIDFVVTDPVVDRHGTAMIKACDTANVFAPVVVTVP